MKTKKAKEVVDKSNVELLDGLETEFISSVNSKEKKDEFYYIKNIIKHREQWSINLLNKLLEYLIKGASDEEVKQLTAEINECIKNLKSKK